MVKQYPSQFCGSEHKKTFTTQTSSTGDNMCNFSALNQLTHFEKKCEQMGGSLTNIL